MQAGQAALQAVLHQVVGAVAVAEERDRVAAEMRNLLDDQALALVDGGLPARAGPGRSPA